MKSFSAFFRHLLGYDRRDEQAHKIKQQMTKDILEIQHQVSKTNRYIEQSTAYKIAKAAGRVK